MSQRAHELYMYYTYIYIYIRKNVMGTLTN